jgi:hypothetical protein
MKPVKPELGASSLFGDIASHVKEVPVEQGGKPKVKEVIGQCSKSCSKDLPHISREDLFRIDQEW